MVMVAEPTRISITCSRRQNLKEDGHSILTCMGSYCIFMSRGVMEAGRNRLTARIPGKCATTLHSCFSVTNKVKINEQNKSIST